jgi:chromatin remodeling complex protein RSC6
MSKATAGAALLGGYALGRTKNAKLAMAVAAWVIKRNVDTKKITSAITSSPALDAVSEQIRKDLLSAGKEVATAVVAARADKLADSLHERTVSLQEQTVSDLPGKKEAEEEEEDRQEEEPEAQEEERPRKAAKPARKKKAAESAAPRGDRAGTAKKRRQEG